MTYIQKCALHVVYLGKLKFKDCYTNDASADIHIAIPRYVQHMMGVFCDRHKLCSAAAPDCLTGQKKGRYRKQE